jgi:Fe-S-cluster containining protein
MGYDNYGRCPMLLGSKCSIYAHRPRTCRVYDCRVFAPSGEEIEDIGKDLIANQVRQWEFRFLGGGHSARRGSKSGCEYLAKEQEELAEEFEEIGSARRSLLAIELRQLF